MHWTRRFSTHTTASLEAVWKRHVTPEDWVEDDELTEAASFPVPPQEGDKGAVTSNGRIRHFTFVELIPNRSMTQLFPVPGGRMFLGHELEMGATGLKLTHWIRLEGPLLPLLIPLAGWPLVRSRPQVVFGLLARALAEPSSEGLPA